MSAIVGFFGLDGRPAETTDLERMLDVLSHRGPDGYAIWREGAAGLGHCRLHTTPESLHEHLPLKRDRLVITADARIDNRAELIALLRLEVQQPEQLSDSELILYAYQRWGEDCPARLLGDFAFAIWDQTKQHLFCARDHFGVKPFYYYYQSGQRFVFASEIKAIFCHEEVPKCLDEVKISDYLLEMFEDKSRTFYLNINRLPPASVMVVGKHGIRFQEYWTLDPKQEIRMKSDEDYAAAYRDLFVEAVRCRLRSAFPIGSMLSGGLDSSSVACVAHDLLATNSRQRLHTFSIVFNQIKRSDEREHVNKVLEKRNFAVHFIEGDQATPFDELDRVLWFQDEPFYAPNFFLTQRAWQSAGETGVRVLLEGLLGDNVVSHGVEYLQELANKWRWLTLARELREFLKHSDQSLPLWKPLSMYFVQQGIKPYVPEAGLKLWRKWRGNPTDPSENRCDVFQSDFSTRTRLRERLARAYQYNRSAKTARQAHYDSLNCGMVQTALEVYNKGCSAFHLETRFPFIDKRLVEFCLAIPGDQKVSQGYTRIIVRRALRGFLPEAIRWRSDKGDLSWSFVNGLQTRQELIHDTLDLQDSLLKKFFNMKIIRDIYNNYRAGKIVDEELLALFLVVVLSVWHARVRFC